MRVGQRLAQDAGQQGRAQAGQVGGPRREDLLQRLAHARVVAAQREDAEAGEQVEVALAALVDEMGALAGPPAAIESDGPQHPDELAVEVAIPQRQLLARAASRASRGSRPSGASIRGGAAIVARPWPATGAISSSRMSRRPRPPPPTRSRPSAEASFAACARTSARRRRALAAEVQATLLEGDLDAEAWERLEEALIYADVGARTTAQVVERLEQEATADGLDGQALTGRLVELLAESARTGDDRIDIAAPHRDPDGRRQRQGKTTTIGKLAWHLRRELGRKVVIGAADTFRAAAVEQLEEWAERAGCDIVKGAPGADPGAVAFDAIAAARARDADVVIIDTAGRLHTKDNLMAELGKVAPGDRQADPRGAARDPAHGRRHHRPERAAPGASSSPRRWTSPASC